jgi:hypothetical protein
MPERHERNVRLAVKVAEDGRPKYVIAAAANINPSTLGGLLTGRLSATDAQRAGLATALGVAEHELFVDEVSA